MKNIQRSNSPIPFPTASPEFIQQTKEIIHETFHALLLDHGVKINGYMTGVTEPSFTSEVNARAYVGLKGACRHLIKLHNSELMYRVEELDLSDTTLCSTFHKAIYAMFVDDINWGRIVALICFSVLVAVKAYRSDRFVMIHSVEGWLTTFIVDNLHQYISKHKGWAAVPDKFSNDKLTEGSSKGGSWLALAAVGVGAALVTALLSR
jgi:hypothetical protein